MRAWGDREISNDARVSPHTHRFAGRILFVRVGERRRYHSEAGTSDLGEADPGLALWGFQPKRAAGDAQPQPKPDAPATAMLDQAARTLQIPALPAHATSIVGWRQPRGGEAEPAGISDDRTVGIADISPLVPGVSCTVWETGRTSAGDGPAGNKITFTAWVVFSSFENSPALQCWDGAGDARQSRWDDRIVLSSLRDWHLLRE